jgi:hypothetical protein
VGDGHGVRRVIGASSEDDAEDIVVVGLGVFESLDDHRADAIGTAVAISSGIPSLACIVALGQEVTVAKTSEAIWVGQNVQATSNRHVDLAVPKCLASHLNQTCVNTTLSEP